MALLKMTRKSRAAAFEALLRPHLSHLYRLAYRFCGNTPDAEDLVQEVLAKLYPKTRELDEIEQLRPWLARTLYHCYIDQLRRTRRSPITATDKNDENSEAEAWICPEPGPEQLAEHQLTAELLERALAALSPDHRAVLTLHDVEGYTLDELTGVLEVPVGTLKSRLHRARARLRGELVRMEPFSRPQRVIA